MCETGPWHWKQESTHSTKCIGTVLGARDKAGKKTGKNPAPILFSMKLNLLPSYLGLGRWEIQDMSCLLVGEDNLLGVSIIALISHASKVMLKILQARFQQYVNHELPDVQAGFRKGRGTRDQIANICWIIEKAVPEKHLFLLYWLCQSLWLCSSQQTVENSERDGNTRPPDLPPEKPVYMSGSNS